MEVVLALEEVQIAHFICGVGEVRVNVVILINLILEES